MNLYDKIAIVLIMLGLLLWAETGVWQVFAVFGLAGVLVGMVASAVSPAARADREWADVRAARLAAGHPPLNDEVVRVRHTCGPHCYEQGGHRYTDDWVPGA